MSSTDDDIAFTDSTGWWGEREMEWGEDVIVVHWICGSSEETFDSIYSNIGEQRIFNEQVYSVAVYGRGTDKLIIQLYFNAIPFGN